MSGEVNTNLNDVPLSSLSYESRNLLSLLLNTKKVLPSDGPQKLPRYWRGLASLINISSELAASINECQDKTARLLELWVQRNDSTATVGRLLEFLKLLDRYDVYDDLMELANEGKLHDSRTSNAPSGRQVAPLEDNRKDLITFDDVRHGSPQMYHAYVLYAMEDRQFVDELISRMTGEGFKLCTEDDLLPGHSTQHTAVAKLILERCHRIILVYSPEFLQSPANSFYMDYAQAVAIEMNMRKIIPCMYRQCQLPSHLSFYSKLYYSPPGHGHTSYFWDRLSKSLEVVNLPRLNSTGSSHSRINITELTPSSTIPNGHQKTSEQTNFLPICAPTKSVSMNGLNTLQHRIQPDDSKSLSNISQISDEKRKKTSTIKRIFDSLKGKKHKKAILVEN